MLRDMGIPLLDLSHLLLSGLLFLKHEPLRRWLGCVVFVYFTWQQEDAETKEAGNEHALVCTVIRLSHQHVNFTDCMWYFLRINQGVDESGVLKPQGVVATNKQGHVKYGSAIIGGTNNCM